MSVPLLSLNSSPSSLLVSLISGNLNELFLLENSVSFTSRPPQSGCSSSSSRDLPWHGQRYYLVSSTNGVSQLGQTCDEFHGFEYGLDYLQYN